MPNILIVPNSGILDFNDQTAGSNTLSTGVANVRLTHNNSGELNVSGSSSTPLSVAGGLTASGSVTAPNLVYTVNNQTIAGEKTFTTSPRSSATPTDGLGLLNRDQLDERFNRQPINIPLTNNQSFRLTEDWLELGVAPWGNPGWIENGMIGSGSLAFASSSFGTLKPGLRVRTGAATNDYTMIKANTPQTSNAMWYADLLFGLTGPSLNQASTNWYVGWSDQQTNLNSSRVFGKGDTGSTPTFNWKIGSTTYASELAFPSFNTSDRGLQIIIKSFNFNTLIAYVWIVDTAGVLNYVGQSVIGAQGTGVRNISFITPFNDRPVTWVQTLTSASRDLHLTHFAIATRNIV
jgi:hypothetical protein